MKFLVSVLLFVVPQIAFANSYIICGTTADWETASVTDFELAISSDSDVYAGPVNLLWNLKLGSEDNEWEETNSNIMAFTTNENGNRVLEIEIIIGHSPSGPVGTRYVLRNLGDEEPVLEKFNIGGFTGPIKIGTYACAASFD